MTAKPFVVSVSWRHAPIELRERFALAAPDVESLLGALASHASVGEVMVVCTCNRVEVYGMTAPGGDVEVATKAAWAALVRQSRVDASAQAAAEAAVVKLGGEAAVRHLFRVVCSLDSLVIGEAQIVGQVRQALTHARKQGTAGLMLEQLVRQALILSRHVRRDTALGQGSASVASVAAQLAERVFGNLAGHQVLMIGAGKMSRLAAQHLRGAGVTSLTVANRSPQRASEFAASLEGVAVLWAELSQALVQADIVVSSTGSTEPVLTYELMKRVAKARRYRPLVIIDIAVPRDAEAAIADIDGMYLFDIDDLERVVAATLQQRQAAAEVASVLVDSELHKLASRSHAFTDPSGLLGQPSSEVVAPVAAALVARLQDILRRELAVASKRLANQGVAPAAHAELERAMQRAVNKVLHRPLTALKFAGPEEQRQLALAVERLFGLGGAAASSDSEGESS